MTDHLFLTWGLLFAAGLAAGLFNVFAGGGSLITLPVLIFLGLPASLANGTNRIAILAQNAVAITSFKKSGFSDLGTSFKLALLTIPGAIAGAFLSLEVPDLWFRRILAVIIVAGVLSLLFPPRPREENERTDSTSWVAYLGLVGIGFYGGFIQAGVGMLFLIFLYRFVAHQLVWVNVHKVFIIAIYTIPALGVFLWSGNVDWGTGAALATGNAAGALIATKLSVKGGEKLIRIVVAIALTGMAVRLVF